MSIDQKADQARQDKLEALYAEDGRHDPAHPKHMLYSGLWVKHTEALAEPEPGGQPASQPYKLPQPEPEVQP
jgi:hypothetical protein